MNPAAAHASGVPATSSPTSAGAVIRLRARRSRRGTGVHGPHRRSGPAARPRRRRSTRSTRSCPDSAPFRTERCAASRVTSARFARGVQLGKRSRMPAPPIGIQPSAYSATCREQLRSGAPPMSTGGPSGVAGLGHDHDGGSSTNFPWNSRRRRATAPASRARARGDVACASPSRRRDPRVSSAFQPKPIPSTNRPPERWSSVAISFAVTIGSRCATRQIPCRRRAVPWPRPRCRARRTGRACACTRRQAPRRRSGAASSGSPGCACAPGRTASTSRDPRPHARARPAASSGRS